MQKVYVKFKKVKVKLERQTKTLKEHSPTKELCQSISVKECSWSWTLSEFNSFVLI